MRITDWSSVKGRIVGLRVNPQARTGELGLGAAGPSGPGVAPVWGRQFPDTGFLGLALDDHGCMFETNDARLTCRFLIIL